MPIPPTVMCVVMDMLLIQSIKIAPSAIIPCLDAYSAIRLLSALPAIPTITWPAIIVLPVSPYPTVSPVQAHPHALAATLIYIWMGHRNSVWPARLLDVSAATITLLV